MKGEDEMPVACSWQRGNGHTARFQVCPRSLLSNGRRRNLAPKQGSHGVSFDDPVA